MHLVLTPMDTWSEKTMERQPLCPTKSIMKTQEAIWMAVTKAAASEKDPRKNGDTKSLRLEEEDEYEEVEKQRERKRERERESC